MQRDTQQSEVADLLAQIRVEYEAAQRGLYAPSLGTSQHAFITGKMERMGAIHSELCGLVGEQAIALIAAQLDSMES